MNATYPRFITPQVRTLNDDVTGTTKSNGEFTVLTPAFLPQCLHTMLTACSSFFFCQPVGCRLPGRTRCYKTYSTFRTVREHCINQCLIWFWQNYQICLTNICAFCDKPSTESKQNIWAEAYDLQTQPIFQWSALKHFEFSSQTKDFVFLLVKIGVLLQFRRTLDYQLLIIIQDSNTTHWQPILRTYVHLTLICWVSSSGNWIASFSTSHVNCAPLSCRVNTQESRLRAVPNLSLGSCRAPVTMTSLRYHANVGVGLPPVVSQVKVTLLFSTRSSAAGAVNDGGPGATGNRRYKRAKSHKRNEYKISYMVCTTVSHKNSPSSTHNFWKPHENIL